jgi:hypothetical protein
VVAVVVENIIELLDIKVYDITEVVAVVVEAVTEVVEWWWRTFQMW